MRPDPPSAAARPAIVIFRSPLFNASESFVWRHALALERYRPLLAGRTDKGNIPSALRGSAFLGTPARLAEQLRSERPRLVHAHFGPDALAALPLARTLGIPLVATLHGYDLALGRARMLFSGRLSWMNYALRRRHLMAKGALFLTVSDALRRAALAQGFPAERTLTHYLGVDLARYGGEEAREHDLILHVGRLVEKKGTAVLIDAVARLPDARLVIIGEGPERARLERRAAGLGGRIRFLGRLGEADVARWMRGAALLAAPSVTARDGDAEGLPTVIVEAAASALPVVATRHSGIPEAVVDGETGLLVTERDVGALAGALAQLLESSDLRHRMGAAARTLADTRFNSRVQTARLEDLYDRVIAQQSLLPAG